MISEVYDLESLKNLFTYTGYERKTKQYFQFVIWRGQNDYEELISHLFRDKLIMIGYNNEGYDYPLLHHLINHYNEYKNLTGEELAEKIYNKSQTLIESQFNTVADWNKKIVQIDLMRILHHDSQAKLTSLKDIEFYMRMDNIEEMPFEHFHYFTNQSEVDKILYYNKHDVKATNLLFDIVLGNTDISLYRGINKIQLRQDVNKEFKIPCLNYNDVKIGEEINKQQYLKNNPGLKVKDLKNLKTEIKPFTFDDCIPKYVKFKTKEFNDFYNNIKNIVVDITGDSNEKQIFPFLYNKTIYNIARGGIHSTEGSRKLIPKDNEILRDADVGSQYPNAIRKRKLYPRHLNEKWLIGYTNNIQKRIDAKHLFKETKDPKYQSIAETYKLALNGGGFGKTGEPNNWQYDPFCSLSCTIGNQFEILMLIEMMEMSGIDVVSANTDGIVCLFDKKLNDRYYEVCHEWEKIVGNEELGQLEYTDYAALIQANVNHYIAIKIKDGKLDLESPKLKGVFATEIEMHKNPSMMIVPIAVRDYFVKGIPVEETIVNHTNIYDFCLRLKVNSLFEARYYYNKNHKITYDKLNRTTRYYISNSGGSLNKCRKSNENISRVNVGYNVTIFNKFEKKENYDINYNFYIRECNKLILPIENKQLTLW